MSKLVANAINSFVQVIVIKHSDTTGDARALAIAVDLLKEELGVII